MLPRSGDVIHVTKSASVQFSSPMLFRVIRVHDWPTYEGWIWLDGYELNTSGEAVERRSIFVQVGGLRQVGKAPDPRMRNARQPGTTTGSISARAAPDTIATGTRLAAYRTDSRTGGPMVEPSRTAAR